MAICRMRPLCEPVKAMLFCGLLFSDNTVRDSAVSMLETFWGPVETASRLWDFTHTAYYDAEMGTGLKRQFVIFERRVPQDSLVDVKLASREVEEEFCNEQGGRRINVDPGLLTPERLLLSTCKNFTHRIYLGRGVFAEITLIATRKGFKTLEWTFPDYGSPEILEFWNQTRRRFLREINA